MSSSDLSVSSGTARLDLRVPACDRPGVVLLLHGGRASSTDAVRWTNLAAARMRPFAGAIRRRGGRARIGVGLVRYRHRGWNGLAADPVTDALWALDRVVAMHGDVPVVLVGHSMGGRAALHTAGHASVRAVAALAPWLPEGDPADQLAGRAVLIAHAPDDRVTDPVASRAYARDAAVRLGSQVEITYREMPPGGHAMLAHALAWHRLVADFALRHLPVSE